MKGNTANMMAPWVETKYFEVLDCKIINCKACSEIKLNAKHSKQMNQILRLLASMGHLCGGGKAERPLAIAGEGGHKEAGWRKVLLKVLLPLGRIMIVHARRLCDLK